MKKPKKPRTRVARLPKPGERSTEPEDLPYVRWVLVKFDDIVEMQALTREVEAHTDSSRLARILGALKLLAGIEEPTDGGNT
jgi:hypothetical protein